jgi:hypothetical protein
MITKAEVIRWLVSGIILEGVFNQLGGFSLLSNSDHTYVVVALRLAFAVSISLVAYTVMRTAANIEELLKRSK